MFIHQSESARGLLVTSTLLSNVKDFSRSQAIAYTAPCNIWETVKDRGAVTTEH